MRGRTGSGACAIPHGGALAARRLVEPREPVRHGRRPDLARLRVHARGGLDRGGLRGQGREPGRGDRRAAGPRAARRGRGRGRRGVRRACWPRRATRHLRVVEDPSGDERPARHRRVAGLRRAPAAGGRARARTSCTCATARATSSRSCSSSSTRASGSWSWPATGRRGGSAGASRSRCGSPSPRTSPTSSATTCSSTRSPTSSCATPTTSRRCGRSGRRRSCCSATSTTSPSDSSVVDHLQASSELDRVTGPTNDIDGFRAQTADYRETDAFLYNPCWRFLAPENLGSFFISSTPGGRDVRQPLPGARPAGGLARTAEAERAAARPRQRRPLAHADGGDAERAPAAVQPEHAEGHVRPSAAGRDAGVLVHPAASTTHSGEGDSHRMPAPASGHVPPAAPDAVHRQPRPAPPGYARYYDR